MPDDDYTSLLIDYSKDYESPESFWRWSAYATIAATLRTNLYIEQGNSRLYPNIYVIFLADSAASRKDRPLALAGDLLSRSAHTKLFRGIASIQGVMEQLSQNVPVKKTGQVLRGGCGIIIAKEFTAALIDDPGLIPRLTDIYDSRVDEAYDYTLRGGSISIKDLCVNILGGSNEELLRTVYTTKASYGGLLRRTFLITPDETRAANSLLDIDLKKYIKEPLLKALEEIKKLNGAVTITQGAKDLYNKWYREVYDSYKRVKDRTGFLQSVHTSALKVAIIIAASHYTTEITKDVMRQAIVEVTKLRPNYEKYAMGSGKNTLAETGALILTRLWEAKDNRIERAEFLLNYWQEIGADDLDRLIVTLEQARLIKTILADNRVTYELTPEGIARFQRKEKTDDNERKATD